MERLLKEKEIRANELSPLTLAFIGDTVFDLLVREDLICKANRPANELHGMAVKKVNAAAQAELIEKLIPILSEDELAVYKRGRNAKSGHLPKNATCGDYHKATGFEALLGYLYLTDNIERIKFLYNALSD